jgi:GTP cyclohydrolase IIa
MVCIGVPRITIIKLLKYREWTEDLGFDREWIIQLKQSQIYNLLQTLFSKKNGFVLPIRYDYYIALSNGINYDTHLEILTEIESITPHGVRVVSVSHKYPAIAQLIASRLLHERRDKFLFLDSEEDENVIAHIDFDYVTRYTELTSVFESYMRIISLYYNITRYVFRLGGITAYLGGDNMVALIPGDRVNELLEIMPSYLKTGIGVSRIPRKALQLASKALTMIRHGLVDKKHLILYDEELHK